MPSFKKPTQEQVEVVFQRMRSPEFAAYFLSRLQNPLWITPMRDRQVFAAPPPPVEVAEGGFRYPHWPASKYLARMAVHAPSEVAAIFADIVTDNASVVGDLLDAALAMPIESTSALLPALRRANDAGTLWAHFKDATDLCVRLAEGGCFAQALTLADLLFSPHFEPGRDSPHNRITHWYVEGLQRLVPVLAATHAKKIIPRLCNWLTATIRAKGDAYSCTEVDLSYIWRPAIEEHEQNHDHDIASAMVGFVRDAFERALRAEELTLDGAFLTLAKYHHLVFKRLRLHLINTFAEEKPELARHCIMDRSLFDDYRFKHEYAMLAAQRLDMLTSEDRDAWFGWIEEGPDMSGFAESFRTGAGRDATEEDRRKRIRYWQFEKLHLVQAHLDERWKPFYQDMLATYGEPRLADVNVYHGPVRCGYESPFTIEDLDKLCFAAAVDTICSWQPGESRRHLDGPSVEGIANTFGEYVRARAEVVSREAELLKDRPAIYLRVFLEQMTQAVNAGQQIDLNSVLGLSKWIVEQPFNQATRETQDSGEMVDRSWQWSREAISALLRAICGTSSGKTPRYSLAEYQAVISDLLGRLTRDPAHSYIVDETERANPRDYDFTTAAINSPRGKALDAVFAYARWIANHTKEQAEGRAIVPGGLESMPDVKEMLEWQVTPENASFESSAIIGQNTGLIKWIDKPWLTANAPHVFELSTIEIDPRRSYGWAAWNAFLIWEWPHIDLYRILRPQYAYSVEQLSQAQAIRDSGTSPLHRLGEHLVVLYGRGDLESADDIDLLHRFLQNAPKCVRSHAITFVGRSMQREDAIPEAIVGRFMDLWDWYWRELGEADARSTPDSSEFESWFTCEVFPEHWSLDRLEAFVTASPTIQFADPIIERLADIAAINIGQVTRIVDRMIRSDKEGWRVYSWQASVRVILKLALAGSENEREMADRLIDYLGRRGYTDFGELLRWD